MVDALLPTDPWLEPALFESSRAGGGLLTWTLPLRSIADLKIRALVRLCHAFPMSIAFSNVTVLKSTSLAYRILLCESIRAFKKTISYMRYAYKVKLTAYLDLAVQDELHQFVFERSNTCVKSTGHFVHVCRQVWREILNERSIADKIIQIRDVRSEIYV